MKQVLSILFCMMMVFSCRLGGNRQEKSSETAYTQEGTRCGRPCRIITLEEDTELGRGHLVSTLWLDKEYGFLYTISIKGTDDLGNKVDMQSFEVTSFTDKPSASDIPDPKQTGGRAADIKKQLQGQLDAIRK